MITSSQSLHQFEPNRINNNSQLTCQGNTRNASPPRPSKDSKSPFLHYCLLMGDEAIIAGWRHAQSPTSCWAVMRNRLLRGSSASQDPLLQANTSDAPRQPNNLNHQTSQADYRCPSPRHPHLAAHEPVHTWLTERSQTMHHIPKYPPLILLTHESFHVLPDTS